MWRDRLRQQQQPRSAVHWDIIGAASITSAQCLTARWTYVCLSATLRSYCWRRAARWSPDSPVSCHGAGTRLHFIERYPRDWTRSVLRAVPVGRSCASFRPASAMRALAAVGATAAASAASSRVSELDRPAHDKLLPKSTSDQIVLRPTTAPGRTPADQPLYRTSATAGAPLGRDLAATCPALPHHPTVVQVRTSPRVTNSSARCH